MDKKSTMKSGVEIPNIKFKRSLSLGLELISLKELKKKLIPLDHDPFKAHRVKFYMIFFITGGEGKHFIDFQSYDFARGTVLFISKGQVHAFDPPKNYEGELIIFTEAFITKNLSDTDRSTFNSLFNYHIYSPSSSLSPGQLSILERIVKSMREEFSHQDDLFKQHILRNLLKQFLLQSERIRKGQGVPMAYPYYNDFIALRKLLDDHIHEERSVNFYAQKLGVSTKKMNAITQSIAKVASKAYITSVLILEVKRLLISSFYSIDEIGYKMGFEEPTNFVKFFKKYTGETPAAFRKSHN